MKNELSHTINLDSFRVQGSKVFTGRDLGENARRNSKIDELDQKFSTVNIVIPNNVYSINPSFLEEFLVNVVLKNGKKNFLSKYTFTSLGNYKIDKPLNEAIDRILREKTAID